MANRQIRWSFSQWENYDQCPFRWKCQSILKLPRSPAGPAAARGTRMHQRVEDYIEGKLDDPNANIDPAVDAVVAKKYIPILDQFRDHPNGARHCEYKLGFDREWRLTSPSVNSDYASCIMVLDAVRSGGAWQGAFKGDDDGICRIGEWKSGKPKDSHADQRKMYAIAGLRAWLADRVEVTTYYLEDTAPPQRFTAMASAYPALTKMWSERRDLMERDEMCAPRPGYYCKWCDYSASKGGPCKFA